MRSQPSPPRSRTRGQRTATGPMPVMISRSGRCPWRTNRRRPSSVSLSAWQLSKLETSASTACARSARAPFAQNLGQRIGKSSWLRERQNISLSHGVSLLCWRSGGVEHLHDTPPYPFTPSPTFAHSSIMPGQANLIADHKTLIADITGQLSGEMPICVVLDTLNKSLMGSESKDTDMSAYVRAAEAIRDAFKCVVIIVHHCGLDDTRPRGHTSLPGAVDAQLAVVREGNAITVTVEMMRDGPEETVVTSMVEVIEVGQDRAGKVLTSLIVKPGEAPAGSNTGARWK